MYNTNYCVKQLDLDSYSCLIEIWERSVLTTHHFLLEQDFLYYKSKLPTYFNNVKLYGCLDDDIIKGFLGVSEDKIEMFFVDSSSMNKGIGSRLLNYAIKELNIRKVDVNEQNIQALAFYKHFGFVEIGYSQFDTENKNYPILHLQLN